MKPRPFWNEEDKTWLAKHFNDDAPNLKARFPERSIGAIFSMIRSLGLHRIGKGQGKWVELDQVTEQSICDTYRATQSTRDAASLFHIGLPRLRAILRRHGIVPARAQSICEQHKEAIIADYLTGQISVTDISKRHNVPIISLRQRLIKWGIYDPTRTHAFANRKGAYHWWIQMYGKRRGAAFAKATSSQP